MADIFEDKKIDKPSLGGLGQIVSLTVKDSGKIQAISLKVDPSGNLVRIVGDNGAGKSTLLNWIAYAFSDGKNIPYGIVKEGAEKGGCLIETSGGYTIKKILRAKDGKTEKLEVREHGIPIKNSPQDFLKSRFAKYPDPQRLVEMTGKQLYEVLIPLTNLDLSKYDQEIEKVKKRQSYIRERKRELGTIHEVPEIEPVDTVELANQKTAVFEFNQEQKDRRAEIDKRCNEAEGLEDKSYECLLEVDDQKYNIEKYKKQILALQKEIEETKEIIKQKENTSEKLLQQFNEIKASIKDLPQPEPFKTVDEINQKLQEAESINREATKYQEYLKEKELHHILDEEFECNKSLIKNQEEEKKKALKNASFGGLELTESKNVSYRGRSWETESEAERYKVAVGLCADLIPKDGLKFLAIGKGSLILSERRKEIAQIAKEKGLTIFLEEAKDEKPEAEPGVFYIVDGELK